MATKGEDDLVTCPICFEQFTNPKYLPCLHTFCHLCLKSYIITQLGGEGKKAKEFPCPVCRQVVAVTDLNLTSEKIADTMPGNHLITSLIERSKTSDKGLNESLCGPCNFGNKNVVAISWCKNCLEPLCENCATHHRGLRRSKHEMIPIENVANEKRVDLLDVDEPCMKHTGKVLEVYCVDHKEMCCVICLATLHRRCEHISTFEEMVTGSKDNESVEQFANCLNKIDEKTEGLRIKADENLNHLNSRHDEISKQVSTTVQHAMDKLGHLESSFLTNLQQIHKAESVKLTGKKERIEVFQQNVRKGQKLLQAVREQGSPKQVFITKEKMKMQLKHHMKCLKVDLKDANCIDYTLNMDGILKSVNETLASVAEVEIKQTLDLSENLNEVSNEVGSILKEGINKPMDVKKLKVTKECSMKIGGDISGGTYLPDGSVVFCDCARSKLVTYDKTGNFLFETKLQNEDGPADACLISCGILVSICNQSYLKRFEIKQNGLKEVTTLPCKYAPWGLSATKDNIIVGYQGEVDVLSLDGKYIKTLSARQGDCVSFVAVSLTDNVYYNDGNHVVCKSLDGREISRFTNENLKRLVGVAVDKFENVYVCGYRSNNVCVFSSDGQNDKLLITDITTPCKIGFDYMETKFYIAAAKDGGHFYSLMQ